MMDIDKDDKKSPKKGKKGLSARKATGMLIYEYATDIETVKLKTKDIAAAVGITARHARRFLTNEFWEKVRDERRKRYAKHAVFVDEGLVRSAVNGSPAAAKLFYEKYEGFVAKTRSEHTGKDGGPIQTASATITKKMTAKEAAAIYKRMMVDDTD